MLFEHDKVTGNHILQKLMPTGSSKDDFALFVVCWKMAKFGKTPKEIFGLIDKEKKGSIGNAAFLDGVKNTLNLWLSEEECESLMNFLDEDKSGSLEMEEFEQKIQFLNNKVRKQSTWLC